MRRRFIHLGALWGAVLAACIVLPACGADDAGKTARGGVTAKVDAPPSPAATPAVPVQASPASPPGPVTAPVEVATAQPAPGSAAAATDGALYVCVLGTATAQQRLPIELSPSVDKLCRKAPEMGPCQYEREECRRRGGKVYTAAGVEITKQVEAEYDKRVMRIRMKSN